VGGTRLKLALLARTGGEAAKVLDRRILDLRPADRTPTALVSRLRRALLDLASDTHVSAVGVGVPGVLDAAAGRICDSPNLPWLNDFSLGPALARAIEVPVHIDNDVNCIAWGEAAAGAGHGQPDQLCLALGTGVGGGIVLGGRLHRGSRGRGAELGHICVDPAGPPCGCGGCGCLEQYASQTGLLRLMRIYGLVDEGRPDDIIRLFSEAASGHPVAADIVRIAGTALGRALQSLQSVFDVPLVILAGGIAGALDQLRPAIEQALRPASGGHRQPLRIEVGTLGTDAGCIGAAMLHESTK